MIFWALWDQSSGGEWTIQCQKMDLHFFGMNFLPEQVNVVNGIFILAMMPLFNYWVYPAISRVLPLTPIAQNWDRLVPHRASSFVVIWMIQTRHRSLAAGQTVGWQFLAYRDPVRGRRHGFDHRTRVRLHPGAKPNEEHSHGHVAPARFRSEIRFPSISQLFSSKLNRWV